MCPSYDRDQLVLLLQQLIQIPSIAPPGDEAPCADLLAQYLGDCPNLELSFQEIGENRKNLIATLKGTGEKKAILLNGHLDVVPVGERANWKYDPFGAQIVDGTMYGRGTGDMKARPAGFGRRPKTPRPKRKAPQRGRGLFGHLRRGSRRLRRPRFCQGPRHERL